MARRAFFALLASFLLVPAASAQPVTFPDPSGLARRGQASVFAPYLAGRRMADGGRFEANSDSVASDALPLGTTARVRNLRNGRVTMVRVRDRLPSSGQRILSVSPRVARLLGMDRNGVARVEVSPLAVPQRDGSVRLGSGTGLPGRRAQITSPQR
jgi:rare lipoprotein A